MIRGDAHLGSYSYPTGDRHFFRLALADPEGLARTRYYLGTFGILVHDHDFSPVAETRRAMRAIQTATRGNVAAITHLIRSPHAPCRDWLCGTMLYKSRRRCCNWAVVQSR